TFTVGKEGTTGTARDLALVALRSDPSPVPIKTEVTVTGRVHAYGYAGSRVVARLFFGDEEVVREEVVLENVKDNEVKLTAKAPGKPGEIKVRMEIGREENGRIVPLPG